MPTPSNLDFLFHACLEHVSFSGFNAECLICPGDDRHQRVSMIMTPLSPPELRKRRGGEIVKWRMFRIDTMDPGMCSHIRSAAYVVVFGPIDGSWPVGMSYKSPFEHYLEKYPIPYGTSN